MLATKGESWLPEKEDPKIKVGKQKLKINTKEGSWLPIMVVNYSYF